LNTLTLKKLLSKIIKQSVKRRLQAVFSGRVQGVGFRFTAERMARRFPVTGFVRNLANGQVELVAEGEEKTLEEFLQAVQEAFQPYIQKVDVRWEEARGECKTFGIKS